MKPEQSSSTKSDTPGDMTANNPSGPKLRVPTGFDPRAPSFLMPLVSWPGPSVALDELCLRMQTSMNHSADSDYGRTTTPSV